MLTLTILLLSFSITFSGKVCSFVALEGIGYPIGTCMYSSEKEPTDPTHSTTFAFEFLCDNTQVTAKYWDSSLECNGRSDLEMDDYYCAEDPSLSGQKCKCRGRGNACDVFTIEMNTTSANCAHEEDESTSIVVNECIPTGYGGSQLFQCDDTTLSMETWTNDKCEGAGEYSEFSYTHLNDNYCFSIKCSQGLRKIRKCKHRGVKATDTDGIHIIGQHINNHHLFVSNIINKHRLENKQFKTSKVSIFNMDFKALIFGLVFMITVIAFVVIIGVYEWCNNRKEYQKI